MRGEQTGRWWTVSPSEGVSPPPLSHKWLTYPPLCVWWAMTELHLKDTDRNLGYHMFFCPGLSKTLHFDITRPNPTRNNLGRAFTIPNPKDIIRTIWSKHYSTIQHIYCMQRTIVWHQSESSHWGRRCNALSLGLWRDPPIPQQGWNPSQNTEHCPSSSVLCIWVVLKHITTPTPLPATHTHTQHLNKTCPYTTPPIESSAPLSTAR